MNRIKVTFERRKLPYLLVVSNCDDDCNATQQIRTFDWQLNSIFCLFSKDAYYFKSTCWYGLVTVVVVVVNAAAVSCVPNVVLNKCLKYVCVCVCKIVRAYSVTLQSTEEKKYM